MKIAITEWQGRISPVFDVATQLLIAEVESAIVNNEYIVKLHSKDFQVRIQEMTALKMDVLICGAISAPLEVALSNAGIEVVPQTCGEVRQVLHAFLTGCFDQDTFLMPGCCGRRQRYRKQHTPRQAS